MHTSQPRLRHLRRQTLIHALSDILHAHMSGHYVTDSSLPLRMTEKAFRMTKQGQHQDDKAVLESQILHFACGSVQDDRKGVQDDKPYQLQNKRDSP